MPRLRGWVLFFVALHDLGKIDIRFQLKAPDTLAVVWRPLKKGRDHEPQRSDGMVALGKLASRCDRTSRRLLPAGDGGADWARSR